MSKALLRAKDRYQSTQQAARVFDEFAFRTRTNWSRTRRVIGKAEHLSKGANPRFVLTSLSPKDVDAKTLYERDHCARGDMENRIKEQRLDLFADRTSTATLCANQTRLYFSSFAYVLISALRRLGLQGTKMARAHSGTIRLKILKIGAQVKISARRLWLSLSQSYPYAALFSQVHTNLQRLPLYGTAPLRIAERLQRPPYTVPATHRSLDTSAPSSLLPLLASAPSDRETISCLPEPTLLQPATGRSERSIFPDFGSPHAGR